MEVALRDARRPQAEAPERGTPDAVWGVRGIMDKDILPGAPAERRRRRRLCALRAMDRLGLLGEENLIPTLARRPALRWLADEVGARWAVLAQLGRIGEPEVFEEAAEWVLENRPRPEEARAYVCRLRSGAIRLPADANRAGRSLFTEGVASGPHPRRATRKEERRRCSRPVRPHPAPRRREGKKGGVDHRLDSVGHGHPYDAASGIASRLRLPGKSSPTSAINKRLLARG